MNSAGFSFAPRPRIVPPLDPGFCPAALVEIAFQKEVAASSAPAAARLALEQSDGSIFQFEISILPEDHPLAATNFPYLERLVKFLLWSRGAFRIYFSGPAPLGESLRHHYATSATGQFDATIMGGRVFEHLFEVVLTPDLPPARSVSSALGRHLNGCRIGFDLGASDRKVAAIRNGECVFSEEVEWNPVVQADPQWHFDQILDSIRRAQQHLPRTDAIGGSSAGVIVNNRLKVASLFRAVPPDLFDRRVKNLFLELRAACGNVPFQVANDGEVTALAGSMALGANGVLGIALGSSQAAGYVNPDGNITTWLNELAFAPVDYRSNAPRDEWSGDTGCGVQYFSQQAVGRLLASAGIALDSGLSLPEKLKAVQALMAQGDPRAAQIYETIGVYLGYSLAHYARFYDFNHLLILGRVTSGPGGELIVDWAKRVLHAEFPVLADGLQFHLPDEKEKRHGQAIAAASLPEIPL